MSRIAVVAGATGLVGAALMARLLADPRYSEIKALARRPLAQSHPKLKLLAADCTGNALSADDAFCCLGTTLKAAGSRAAFEDVDYRMVLDFARAALGQGAQRLLVVSAAGTAANSPSFYSRVKARMEHDVAQLGYRTVHIVRPSLLLGARAENRPMEHLAQKVMPLLNPLLLGGLAKYRAVSADEVAAALVTLAWRDDVRCQVHHLPLEH